MGMNFEAEFIDILELYPVFRTLLMTLPHRGKNTRINVKEQFTIFKRRDAEGVGSGWTATRGEKDITLAEINKPSK